MTRTDQERFADTLQAIQRCQDPNDCGASDSPAAIPDSSNADIRRGPSDARSCRDQGFLLLVGVASLKSDQAQTADRRADVEHIGSATSLGLCPPDNLGDVGSSDLEFLCRTVGIVEVDAVAGIGHLPRLVPGINGAHEHRHSLPDPNPTATRVLPRHSDLCRAAVDCIAADRRDLIGAAPTASAHEVFVSLDVRLASPANEIARWVDRVVKADFAVQHVRGVPNLLGNRVDH